MHVICHQLVVPAPRAAVWTRLTRTDRYADWCGELLHISGPMVLGSTRTFTYARTWPGQPHVFRCRIVAAEPGRSLRWQGPLGAGAALVRADHGLTLEDGPTPGTTWITHDEHFTGWLVPALWPLMRPQVTQAHRGLNQALAAGWPATP